MCDRQVQVRIIKKKKDKKAGIRLNDAMKDKGVMILKPPARVPLHRSQRHRQQLHLDTVGIQRPDR